MAAHEARLHARLYPPPAAVCYSDPDRREPDHLRAVLRGQHAGRHGAHAPGREARDAGRDRALETGTRLRQTAAVEQRARRRPELTRHAVLSRNRCACSPSISARPTTDAISRPRSARACGRASRSPSRYSSSGLCSTSRFALAMAFFRATYLDFWGVVLCVVMMSISGAVLHHRRPVSGCQALGLVPISGYDAGLDAIKFLILPVVIGVVTRHRQPAAAGTGRSSSRRWARTMCARRAPRACPNRW